MLERIRQAKPRRLFIVADGPRPNVESDHEDCRTVRRLFENGIDWPCNVSTNIAADNMGCRKRMSSGLNWVFEQVDRAIILEDDCVPAMSFFPYCESLLDRFRDDSRVMQVCGTNVSQEQTSQEFSYYFSKFGPVWGWASWRRAWMAYDVEMRDWPRVVAEKLYRNFWEYPGEAEFRLDLYEKVYRGEVDTWDLQWGFAKFLNSGLSITPSKNLICNIGYGATATHTKGADSPVANLKTDELRFPLIHYPFVIRDRNVELNFHNKITPAKYREGSLGSKL